MRLLWFAGPAGRREGSAGPQGSGEPGRGAGEGPSGARKPGTPPEGRLRRAGKKLALLLVSLLVSGLLIEGALTVAGVHFEASLHTPDPDRGWAFRAGARGWTTKEGLTYVRVSSDGLRDREHAVGKDAGAHRIALLGDSFCAAYSTPIEETFWSILEKKLDECGAFPGKRVEVLNFGVGGYGTAHELITLRKHVWKYEPDMVVLAYYPGNDLLNNERSLNPNNAALAPYFVLRDGELVLDDGFRDHVLLAPAALRARNAYADLMNHSELLLFFSALRRGFARAHAEEGELTRSTEEALVPFVPPEEGAMSDAWRVTEALIKVMRDEVAARGADFRVVTLSAPEQVDPRLANRESWKTRLGVPDLYYQERRLRAFADAEHIRLLALAPAMAERAGRTGVFFHGKGRMAGEGHYNPAGHRAVAELIAADYCPGSPAPDTGARAH